MTFEVEQLLLIKSKVYLLTKSLNDNVRFKLSDNTLLGGFEIENWHDNPKARDSSGNFRVDNFAFVLKNEIDKKKITPGDILKLSDLYVTVVESAYTVSGKILAVLECGTGMLAMNTELTDQEKKWRVSKNNLIIGRQNDSKLQKQVTDNFWFLYSLEPFDHVERPEVGRKLQITINGF